MASPRKAKTKSTPAPKAAKTPSKVSSKKKHKTGSVASKRSPARQQTPSAARGKSKPKAGATARSAAAKKPKTPSRAATSAKSKPAPAKAKTKPKTKRKARKPAIDPELRRRMREALVHQRQKLLAVVQSTQAQMAAKSGDLADVSDRASEGFEDELAVGLMAIEAAKLDDIEAAIRRIDEGQYGICLDCGKLVPRKRLEVLPFARRCLPCEGKKERRALIDSGYDDD